MLFADELPTFGGTLSLEESEALLSYLTVPYCRVPLVCGFFAARDRSSYLMNGDLQALFTAVRHAYAYYSFSPLCLLVSSSLSSESNNFSSSSSRMRMFYYFCSPGSGSLSLDSFFSSVNPHFLFIFPFFSVRSCSKAERGSTSA